MKNRVNKQIIKALSVGLAASMALQPVTAFATDGTEGGQPTGTAVPATSDSQSSTSAPENTQTAPAMNEQVSNSIDTAEEKVDLAIKEGATVETSSTSETPEVEEPVSEASAQGETQPGAQVEKSVNDELKETKGALEAIDNSVKEHDKLTSDATSKTNTYNDALNEASISETAFEGALTNAETPIATAKTETDKEAKAAEADANAVQALADKVYADAAAATAAREEAQKLADAAQTAANNAKKESSKAQTQLEAATTAQTNASDDLKAASTAYTLAQDAVDKAQENLEKILKQYGIHNEDGTVDLEYLDIEKKNYGKSDVNEAVSSALNALNKALSNLTDAENDLDDATKAKTKADNDLKAAQDAKDYAEKNIDQAERELKAANEALEKATLIEQVNQIRKVEVNTFNNQQDDKDAVNKADKDLAKALVTYKLYEEGFKNPTITVDASGRIIAKYNVGEGENAKEVTREFAYELDSADYGDWEEAWFGYYWKESVHWLIVDEITKDTVPNIVDQPVYRDAYGKEVDETGKNFQHVNGNWYSYTTQESETRTREVYPGTYYVKGNEIVTNVEIKRDGKGYYYNSWNGHNKVKVYVTQKQGYYYWQDYGKVFLSESEAANNVTEKTGYDYYWGEYTYYEQSYEETVTRTHYVTKGTKKVQQGTKIVEKSAPIYKERDYFLSVLNATSKADAQKAADEKLGIFNKLSDDKDRDLSGLENAASDAAKAATDAENAKNAALAKHTKVIDAYSAVLDAANALKNLKANADANGAALTALQEAYNIAYAKYEAVLADYKTAQDNALKAQDAANRAQKLVAAVSRVQSSGSSDDTPTGGGDDTIFIPTVVTPATTVVAPAVENPEAPAVLGARTTRRSAAKKAADTETVATDNSNGNSDNAEVAGAQKEETKTPEVPKEETKIEDNETALAATPELEEKGFAWWWLLILAAIAGVSVEEYTRRKRNKAKAEAKNSTKINK